MRFNYRSIRSVLTIMSMKENLVFWAEGVEKADKGDNAGALEHFSYITEPFARIYYNMAAIQLRQGNINQAEKVNRRIC